MLTATKRVLKLLGITAISVMFIVFSANNHDFMDIALFPLPYTLSVPKFLFAIGCFALGVLVGGFSINLKLNKSKRLYRKEHKRVMALQTEIKSLHERKPQPLTTVGQG